VLYGNPPTAICEQFMTYSRKLIWWGQSLSYIIIGLNFILREICIQLINWIGYKTETERLTQITILTFAVTFLNTAILPLLVNANMQEQPISFGLKGAYADFNS
jgi:hypothetical protein